MSSKGKPWARRKLHEDNFPKSKRQRPVEQGCAVGAVSWWANGVALSMTGYLSFTTFFLVCYGKGILVNLHELMSSLLSLIRGILRRHIGHELRQRQIDLYSGAPGHINHMCFKRTVVHVDLLSLDKFSWDLLHLLDNICLNKKNHDLRDDTLDVNSLILYQSYKNV